MEDRKRLKMPRGNVHDILYLYSILGGINYRGGRVERNHKTFAYLKKVVNDYNEAKASKYGLSFRPREVNVKVIEHLVAELEYLKLIQEDKEHLVLTSQGEYVASLIEKGASEELRRLFTKLMLENFSIFEYFLKQTKTVSNGEAIPIPFISSDFFDRCGMDPSRIAEKCVSILAEHAPALHLDLRELHNSIETAGVKSLGKRTDKISKLQAVIEKFVILEAFGPVIKSRRVYDFVRSRLTRLELTNYGKFYFEGLQAYVTYLICDFTPAFDETVRVEYSKGTVYVNHPSFRKIHELFKKSLLNFYHVMKDDFGYVRVPDLRDAVCRELKISDNLFDEYIKRIYKEEPHWLSFTYGGAEDKVTEKRLPIIFEKPMREFFTLVKIKGER